MSEKTSPICIVVTGAKGRMGLALIDAISHNGAYQLVGQTELMGPTLDAVLQKCSADAVVDFTSPAASLEHARVCSEHSIPLVIGTTGFSDADKQRLELFAKKSPMLWAPNMSVGVNLFIQTAARLAAVLGNDFDIEIVEAHHRHKKDAPSGTALRLAEELRTALKRDAKVIRASREGDVGARPADEIGIQSMRGGDVVGEHTVYFLGDGERIELSHRATSREHFAKGALRAARFLVGKPARLYNFSDVLV